MQRLNLHTGVPFAMGETESYRVVHPDMGATQLTLNSVGYGRGVEFPQHTHEASEDLFLILEGSVDVRQGDCYTPLRKGEVVFIPGEEMHGSVTTSHYARSISFQSPPDLALYRGERDSSKGHTTAPAPPEGFESAVQIIDPVRASPLFRKPGAWRTLTSRKKGARHLGAEWGWLREGDQVTFPAAAGEEIWVVLRGCAEVEAEGASHAVGVEDVVFLRPGDAVTWKHVGADVCQVLRCRALS